MVSLPVLLGLAGADQAAPQPSCPELPAGADAASLEGRLAEAAGAYRRFLAQCRCSCTGHERLIAIARQRNPHHHLTAPEDVTRCIAALCHPATCWLTGNTIHVDDGENTVG